MACFLRHVPETTIRIPSNRQQQGVTHYTIAVTVGPHTWTVSHRYREFRELHERLVAEQGIAKDLLPPKKVLGNRSSAFLEQRQRQLEAYLQQVLAAQQAAVCREFVEFLHFNRYDLVYLLQDMAQRFFLQGALTIDEQAQRYDFSALELFAVAERLRMPSPVAQLLAGDGPPSNTTWKCYDFAHVVEFCTQLDGMRVVRRKAKEQQSPTADAPATVEQPTPPAADLPDSSASSGGASPSASVGNAAELIGTSNIDAAALQLDLGAFHALTSLTLDAVPPQQLCALGTLRRTLRSLSVRRTRMQRLAEVLLCDSLHPEDDVHDPARQWTRLATLDVSDNALVEIDASVTLLPALESLHADRNRIERLVTNTLNQLPALSELSLCDNRIGPSVVDWHLELGNVRALHLAGNAMLELRGLRKLWSLVRLDVQANRLSSIDEILHIAGLPCLEDLRLAGNPMATIVDYRPKVLSRFGERAAELQLDGSPGTPTELDMALVMDALRHSEQLRKTPATTNVSR